jgi:hypothetical protein
MKLKAKTLIAMLVLASAPASAFAYKEGGGGAVVYCPESPDGFPVKALDLYEGRKTLVVERSSATMDAQINAALARLPDSMLAFDVREVIDRLRIERLEQDESMHKTPDLGDDPIVIQDGCSIEWAAYYKGRNDLKLVTKFFNAMSATDKAALMIHEGVYKIARTRGFDPDSSRTRRVVALLFAKNANPNELASLTRDLSVRFGPHPAYWESDYKKIAETPTYYQFEPRRIGSFPAKIQFTVRYKYEKNRKDASISATCLDRGGEVQDQQIATRTLVKGEKDVALTVSLSANCRFLITKYQGPAHTKEVYANGEKLFGAETPPHWTADYSLYPIR